MTGPKYLHSTVTSNDFFVAKAALDASRATQAALLSMQQANTSMQSALAGWGNFEQESVRCLNGKYNGQQDPVMRDQDGVPKMLNRMSLYYAQMVKFFVLAFISYSNFVISLLPHV